MTVLETAPLRQEIIYTWKKWHWKPPADCDTTTSFHPSRSNLNQSLSENRIRLSFIYRNVCLHAALLLILLLLSVLYIKMNISIPLPSFRNKSRNSPNGHQVFRLSSSMTKAAERFPCPFSDKIAYIGIHWLWDIYVPTVCSLFSVQSTVKAAFIFWRLRKLSVAVSLFLRFNLALFICCPL